MSLLLSAQTGEQVSIAQLMGEEAVDVAGRTAEAEDAAKLLEKKMKKAGLHVAT